MKRTLLLLLLTLLAVAPKAQLPRGIVMLDVSRHFMPIDRLYAQVDELARYGIPALHLHLTDAAGWRMEIEAYPLLTRQAAWRTHPRWTDWWAADRRYATQDTGFGGYYRQDELRALVRYAQERGVMIIPEIEFPAHSEEVTAAYPHLACTGQPYTSADLCIGSDSTYLFLQAVLREVASVFTAPYIHLGGDEAGGEHWRTCPRCQGMTQVQAMRRANQIVRQLGRKMICWDEVYAQGLRDTTVTIMVWRSPDTARDALATGHPVIYAPARYCYLDKYQDRPDTQPQAMGGYLPVDSIYAHYLQVLGAQSPGDNHLTSPSASPSPLWGRGRGEGLLWEGALALCLWTEYVPTPQDAERMLWPRALALAEALSPQPRSPKAFRRWAERESRNLRARGINAYDLRTEHGQRREYLRPVRHLATSRPLTYNAPYHPYYPASGPRALVDGLRGGWSNTDGRWQGFLGPVDVTIDLGPRPRRLRSVEATFFQSRGVEIFFPSRLRLSVSDDGQAWTTLSDQTFPDDPRPDTQRLHRWRGKARARYLRLQADTAPQGGWLFTDELVVR